MKKLKKVLILTFCLALLASTTHMPPMDDGIMPLDHTNTDIIRL